MADDRAALQANARWSADFLALAQIAYNDTRLEAFYLDPDELPVVDSKTKLPASTSKAVPSTDSCSPQATSDAAVESDFAYFSPLGTVIGTRDGLNVFDARFTYMPNPPGQPGPFFGAEAALQTHRDLRHVRDRRIC